MSLKLKIKHIKRGFSGCDCCDTQDVKRFYLVKLREQLLRLLCYSCSCLPKYVDKEILEIHEVD